MDSDVKTMYFCPSCKAVLGSNKPCYCGKCGTKMAASPYKATQWIDMSAKQRDTAVTWWLGLSESERAAAIKDTSVKKEPEPAPAFESAPAASSAQPVAVKTSVWIGLLRGCAYLIMIGGIVASLVFAIPMMKRTPLLGIGVIALGILASLLSVAGVMVFLDMAADISAIRQMIGRDGKR